MHDRTAVRTEGIAEPLRLCPTVKAEADEGYRGLANEFPDHVTAPPNKTKDDAPDGEKRAWCEMRRHQSSRRIAVELAGAGHERRPPSVAHPRPSTNPDSQAQAAISTRLRADSFV